MTAYLHGLRLDMRSEMTVDSIEGGPSTGTSTGSVTTQGPLRERAMNLMNKTESFASQGSEKILSQYWQNGLSCK